MKIGRPPKEERNKEIVEKKMAGWSFRKIAYHYGLNVKTVWEIFQRSKDLYKGLGKNKKTRS